MCHSRWTLEARKYSRTWNESSNAKPSFFLHERDRVVVEASMTILTCHLSFISFIYRWKLTVALVLCISWLRAPWRGIQLCRSTDGFWLRTHLWRYARMYIIQLQCNKCHLSGCDHIKLDQPDQLGRRRLVLWLRPVFNACTTGCFWLRLVFHGIAVDEVYIIRALSQQNMAINIMNMRSGLDEQVSEGVLQRFDC